MIHTQYGAIYEVVCFVDSVPYSRPAYIKDFNCEVFAKEIRQQYKNDQ